MAGKQPKKVSKMKQNGWKAAESSKVHGMRGGVQEGGQRRAGTRGGSVGRGGYTRAVYTSPIPPCIPLLYTPPGTLPAIHDAPRCVHGGYAGGTEIKLRSGL